MSKQFNIRNLPEHTARQIDELCARMGVTKTQLVLLAIERLHQKEINDDNGDGQLRKGNKDQK